MVCVVDMLERNLLLRATSKIFDALAECVAYEQRVKFKRTHGMICMACRFAHAHLFARRLKQMAARNDCEPSSNTCDMLFKHAPTDGALRLICNIHQGMTLQVGINQCPGSTPKLVWDNNFVHLNNSFRAARSARTTFPRGLAALRSAALRWARLPFASRRCAPIRCAALRCAALRSASWRCALPRCAQL